MKDTTDKAAIFYEFLGEYADFFGEMEQFEQQKLTIMLSGKLPEIEHAIAVSQANAKQLDNLESKRIRLQQEAGFGTMSMSELAAAAVGERAEQLTAQFGKLGKCIDNIRFYNTKSMAIAEKNLRIYSTRHSNADQEKKTPTMLEVKA